MSRIGQGSREPSETRRGALTHANQTEVLSLPSPHGKIAHITRVDIAEVIAGVLSHGGHENRTYEITGPEAVDLFDIAIIVSEAWKRKIDVRDMAPEVFGRMLSMRGVPEFAVAAVVALRAAAGAGEYAEVRRDAPMLAGRPVQPMSDYVRRR